MNEQPGIRRLKSPFLRGSLRTRIIAWSFVPTAIILFAVALVAFHAYQQVTEDLVIQRNRELTRLSASQLAAELTEYTELLADLGRTVNIREKDPGAQRAALKGARNRLVVFDGGVVLLDTFGRVVAAEPERPEILGQDWSDRIYFRQLIRSSEPVFSNIVPDGPQGTEVIVVAVPITGEQGEFLGTAVGMFRLDATTVSAFYGGIVKLRIVESGSVSLVDGNGRAIYHSDPDRIGEDVSWQPVVQEVLSGRVGSLRTRDFNGRDTVASFAPVPGTPWGLVTMESWAMLIRSSQGYRQFLLLLLVLGVVVPALVVAVGVRRITRPIVELISAAQEVAGGNFGQTITATTGDEIEELAEQFNRMSAQLQESYAYLERRVADRTKELATLNAVAQTVSQSLELKAMLTATLDKVLEVLELEAGAIYLKSLKTGQLQMVCHRGLSETLRSIVARGIISARVAETGTPLVIDDLSTEPDVPKAAIEEGYCSLASIPILSKGEVQGVLTTASRQLGRFRQRDVDLLLSIGHQIGVAVENARLYEQAQQLAVLEERQRLARDLHDSVTQALYGVTLYAEAAARLLSSGEVGLATNHLCELRSTAQEALREMRLLIFELRPPVLEKEGLVTALQARLEAVEGRAGLKTVFKVEGDDRPPPEVEEGLYRIAQEALNNALKHAQARTITVVLHQGERTTMLEIADDGVGFDPASARQQGGLGLSGMEERAARLGGRLTVNSRPGEGTRVRVEVERSGELQGTWTGIRETQGSLRRHHP